jgi:hypothetical protein
MCHSLISDYNLAISLKSIGITHEAKRMASQIRHRVSISNILVKCTHEYACVRGRKREIMMKIFHIILILKYLINTLLK